MDTLTTSIDSETGGVLIQWAQPDDNSQSITSFDIYIGGHDGVTFYDDENVCSGADPEVT